MVILWTHDESKHQHKIQANAEVTVINELSETSSNEIVGFALGNGKCCEGESLKSSDVDSENCSKTYSETRSNLIVSAEIHNEVSVKAEMIENDSPESSDNISKVNENVDYLYRNVNGDCLTGASVSDKKVRMCNVTYKKNAKVSMLIHRHTL